MLSVNIVVDIETAAARHCSSGLNKTLISMSAWHKKHRWQKVGNSSDAHQLKNLELVPHTRHGTKR